MKTTTTTTTRPLRWAERRWEAMSRLVEEDVTWGDAIRASLGLLAVAAVMAAMGYVELWMK